MRRRARRGASAAFIAALALLAAAPLAAGAYDPLGSGTTKLTLDPGFLALLRHNQVKLRAIAPAKLVGNVVSFPLAGGKFDPVAARGTLEHEGGLFLQAGPRKLPLRSLQLKTTQRHAPFSVKAGGSQMKLASVDGLAVSRQAFGERIDASGLELSTKLATRLGKKLDRRGLFKAGQPLGRVRSTAQPETIAVLGRGRASLTLDPGILAKLGSLFVAVNPIFPAEHPGAEFTLPIFGGTIAPDGAQGTIETAGALEFLQQGGGQLFWREGRLELGAATASAEVEAAPAPPFAGKLGRIAIASLAPGAVAADPKARTVRVSAAALALSAASAATFNELFARPQGKEGVFVAGEPLGTVSFTAQGQ